LRNPALKTQLMPKLMANPFVYLIPTAKLIDGPFFFLLKGCQPCGIIMVRCFRPAFATPLDQPEMYVEVVPQSSGERRMSLANFGCN
jgi:hypothetical protein